ncbi:hypothetical protein [Aquimarina muelleri]|uniref:DUF4294 domain-containing protein n=1 Tax=Aquimarina muelleri TaxID=279356 RepID=A0A918JY75_9FLAO|nr:hypothetical protein [Aquimarina muelleri]MCX2762859.1 hypothetical protein [Aquimarina muelleri]GGX26930.1 hypothetical protein GCM10007384_30110 [Aquimarina muelleri]
MKKLLPLLFLFFSLQNYAQTLSKTRILYERKNKIVMNDGKHYEIIVNKPFYSVSDSTIQKHKQITDHVFRLNRVLILKNENTYIELIEWVKENMKIYQSRKPINYNFMENPMYDSLVSPSN